MSIPERFNQFDRPTRALILRMLADLASGSDVAVVAVPYELSVEIARMVVMLAKAIGIECGNVKAGDGAAGDGPRVKPARYERVIPLPTPKTRVHIDVSASFERQNVKPPACRSVYVD